jgi:D-aspartate ligase
LIKIVIILGGHIQALGISRIAKQSNLFVHLIDHEAMCLTRFSRSCDKFNKYKDEVHLKNLLLKLNYKPHTSIILPTNDKMVKFLSDNHNELKKIYCLPFEDPEIIDICINKRKTYESAQSNGIPVPDTYFPDDFIQVNELKSRLQYPVIIKPAIMHTFFERTKKKAFMCNNEDELINNYKKAILIIPEDEIIIQEYLPGEGENLFSYCSLCIKGEIFGSIIANRIRQNPMDFGKSTTFAISKINERINYLGEKFLKSINYLGLSEVEFMYDNSIEDYKLLEINPRTWKWHTLAKKLDVNLIIMLIDQLNNNIGGKKINNKDEIAWIDDVTDLFISLSEIIKGKLKFKDYVNTIKLNKEHACWDIKDPIPFLMYILLIPYFLFKR